MFDELKLWIDPVARVAPECMAVDEWLLETAQQPVLRVYRWLGNWGSVGYFGDLEAAKETFPEVEWVRRWTGGGTVDHRADWSYTLVVPKSHQSPSMHGSESYCTIHKALVQAIQAEVSGVVLSTGKETTGAAACFQNPVCHDVINTQGAKLAGAGQRRNKLGLLHQGSVALPCNLEISQLRAERLAAALSSTWNHCELSPPDNVITRKVNERYATEEWTKSC